MSDKTEKPTPKRLRDARKKGEVASSKEIISAALILAFLGLLIGTMPTMVQQFRGHHPDAGAAAR
ncbi:MAG: EscU/YscU/HrcU family type III secretion system export apparatus switch protein [Acetobacteraceae bacterium]